MQRWRCHRFKVLVEAARQESPSVKPCHCRLLGIIVCSIHASKPRPLDIHLIKWRVIMKKRFFKKIGLPLLALAGLAFVGVPSVEAKEHHHHNHHNHGYYYPYGYGYYPYGYGYGYGFNYPYGYPYGGVVIGGGHHFHRGGHR